MYSDSHTDPLASVPLFADLPPEERAVLLEKMQLLSVRKGEHVVHQGDQADCLYYVLRGRLDAETAWNLARIDEEFQADRWGRDEDADLAAQGRLEAMRNAERFYRLSRR